MSVKDTVHRSYLIGITFAVEAVKLGIKYDLTLEDVLKELEKEAEKKQL